MAETDFSEEALDDLDSAGLVAALGELQPDDPTLETLDLDAVARRIDPKKLDREQFVDLLETLHRLGESGANLDLSAMDPQTFARIIARASDGQLEAAVADLALRSMVLDELFRRMQAHFQPERAREGTVVMAFRVTGGSGDDYYAVQIQDRKCSVSSGPSDDAKTTITLKPADLLKLATGNASAKMLFLRRKVKVAGSLGFAANFMDMFEIPKA